MNQGEQSTFKGWFFCLAQFFFESISLFFAMDWFASVFSPKPALSRPTCILFNLPPFVWSQITALLTSEDIVRLGCASPFTRNFLRSPHVVTHLHIHIPARSYITLDTFPHEWFAPYPMLTSMGLTSLKQGQKGLVLSPDVLAQFPRSLRHLHLTYADNLNDNLLKHLPRMLLTLHLEHNAAISDEGIENLPEWLETLHLPSAQRLTSFCIAKLPRSLRDLKFQTQNEILDGHMAHMPALTSLQVLGENRIPGPSIAALPRTLTRFNWSINKPMDEFDVELLPPLIRDLTISQLTHPDAAIARLNPLLQRLTIVSTTNPLSEGITSKGILALPPSLVYLELMNLKEVKMADLPRSLHSLSLPRIQEISLEELAGIPSSLRILKLRCCANFEDAWFAHLPPKIHFLACRWNANITAKLIRHTPPSLLRLELKDGGPPLLYDWEDIVPHISIQEAIPVTSALQLPYASASSCKTYLLELNAERQQMRVLDYFPKPKISAPIPVLSWFERLWK